MLLNGLTQVSGILTGLFLFILLMVLHELGHFLTGLFLGFKIEEFSIFLGPKLFGIEHKGIKYSFRLIPLGAFVKFKGEMNGEVLENEAQEDLSQDKDNFGQQALWKRFFVILNGPVVNIFSGFLAFFILFSSLGYTTQTIEAPVSQSLAEQVGLQEGDKLVQLGETKIYNDLDLRAFLLMEQKLYQGKDLKIKFLRIEDGKSVLREEQITWSSRTSYRLGLFLEKEYYKGGEYFKISEIPAHRKELLPLLEGDVLLEVNGIEMTESNRPQVAQSLSGETSLVKIYRPLETKEMTLEVPLEKIEQAIPLGLSVKKSSGIGGAFKAAYHYSFSIVKMTFKSIAYMIQGHLAPKESLSGPVGVVHAISKVSTADIALELRFIALVEMFALLSISIGLMNLFPIPPLDGFLIFTIIIEAFRGGKKLSPKLLTVLTLVGLGIMLLLFVFGFYFDILRLLN